jgi:hypothetical protein
LIGVVFAAALLCLPAAAGARFEEDLIYRFLLLDSSGSPLLGPVDIGVAIWRDPSSSEPVDLLYLEVHRGVAPRDGEVAIPLGRGVGLNGDFSHQGILGECFLQLSVDGEVLSPRQACDSVPWPRPAAGSDPPRAPLGALALDESSSSPTPSEALVTRAALFRGSSIIAAAPALTQEVTGTTVLVESTLDQGDASPGDGVCAGVSGLCTLRAAIDEANALPGLDTIELPAGHYLLTLTGGDEDLNATGDLDILDSLFIRGLDETDQVVIDAGGIDRVCHSIFSGLTVERVSITGGNGEGGVYSMAGGVDFAEAVVEANGGTGVRVWGSGEARFTQSRLSNNDGPGVLTSGATPLRIENSLIEGNEVGVYGSGMNNRIYDSAIRSNRDGGISTDLGSLWVRNSEIRENGGDSSLFGGIRHGGPDSVVIDSSTISGNRSSGPGAGILANTNGLSVLGSTISDNSSAGGGGGVYARVFYLEIFNSTISGNLAAGEGGGILFVSRTDGAGLDLARINNSTIFANGSATGGGLGLGSNRIPFEVGNSIIAGNSAASDGPDCYDPAGTVVSHGFNLIGDGSGCGSFGPPFDQVGDSTTPLDPLLAPLADNGGPTQTHALLAGSPALDAGSPDPAGTSEAACRDVDQRGVPRPQGIGCDIGAFELEPSAIAVEIDIKPGSDSNPVNPFSRGLIPVALLGSESFDVADVDVTALAFGPNGAAPAHPQAGHPADVNGDGFSDLVSHYRTPEAGIAIGDTEACVTGESVDGMPFEGCDSIRTEPSGCGRCEGSPELLLAFAPLMGLYSWRRSSRG